jgi:hypothetical protein
VTPCGLIKNIALIALKLHKYITVIYNKQFLYVPYMQAKILLQPKTGMRNMVVYESPNYKQRHSGSV